MSGREAPRRPLFHSCRSRHLMEPTSRGSRPHQGSRSALLLHQPVRERCSAQAGIPGKMIGYTATRTRHHRRAHTGSDQWECWRPAAILAAPHPMPHTQRRRLMRTRRQRKKKSVPVIVIVIAVQGLRRRCLQPRPTLAAARRRTSGSFTTGQFIGGTPIRGSAASSSTVQTAQW